MKFFTTCVVASIAVVGVCAGQGYDETSVVIGTSTGGSGDVGTYSGMMVTSTQTGVSMYQQPSPGSAAAPVGVAISVPPVETISISGGHGGGRMYAMVQSLLQRLASFFDLTNISSTSADTPVGVEIIYNPMARRFSHMTTTVIQSGNGYYVPACAAEDVARGAVNPQDCTYGMVLGSVPMNAAQTNMHVLHTLFAIIRRLARPRFMFGGLNRMNSFQ
ncbi:hypothetical protein IWW48_003422 [Coemansia sp. RSA 1200]|nr:hypothetical protein IWW48_003422 [Coemansia sp. RSA 1200]